MSWLLDLIAAAISEFVDGLLDLVGGLIDNMFIAALNANQTSFITGICNFTTTLALSLLAVASVKRIFDVYIMQTKGDPDQSPIEILYRVALSVAVIGSNGWVWTELKNFSLALSHDVEAVDTSVNIESSLRSAVNIVAGNANAGMLSAFILFIFFLIILLVVFGVITALKAAQVTLQRVLFPLFAVDLITSEQEKWNNFILSYVVNFCSYAVQSICFTMAGTAIAGLGIDTMRYFTLAVAWIVIAIKAPEWLQKYMYSSGLGRAVAAVGRTASLLLIRL